MKHSPGTTDGMTGALRIRTERLACGFPLKDNYFAWQAFGRGYQPGETASLPPYLEARNFETVRRNAGRVRIVNESITALLAARPAASVDAFVLLDAQDWMTDSQLSELWAEITRTATPGARVIYRTAAAASPLPGHGFPMASSTSGITGQSESLELGARDRSAIYGGFHLHVKRDPADERLSANASVMDGIYRHQRHIYDLTRRYYLLGRNDLIAALKPPRAARCSRSAAAPPAISCWRHGTTPMRGSSASTSPPKCSNPPRRPSRKTGSAIASDWPRATPPGLMPATCSRCCAVRPRVLLLQPLDDPRLGGRAGSGDAGRRAGRRAACG
jgi:hypothetical protein